MLHRAPDEHDPTVRARREVAYLCSTAFLCSPHCVSPERVVRRQLSTELW